MLLDKLIVMNDVSGLADKSDEFANFLTVSRKYGITCLHFLYYISKIYSLYILYNKTKLANDNVTWKNI